MGYKTLALVNTVRVSILDKKLKHSQTFFHIGAPVYISNPHFYQADPSLLHAVHGLKPVRELHETFFKIQPVS